MEHLFILQCPFTSFYRVLYDFIQGVLHYSAWAHYILSLKAFTAFSKFITSVYMEPLHQYIVAICNPLQIHFTFIDRVALLPCKVATCLRGNANLHVCML